MSAVVRLGDTSTGHPHCYPARQNIEASDFVSIGGRGVHCVGHAWAAHGACKDHSPHGGAAAGGSAFVSIEGKAVCRVGDPISCGDTMVTGSDFVFIDQ